ncbi:hypothetical protein SLEP1_g57114 [Rubroshorea leprosula]|uniref:DNA-(apurinic or apyrimidinic site) endonuclease n=2 Tax=Rubroshorea leprosula TaxID=152421 RepID=A0AAV5MKI0_9ROSI|nr:hypothetical protein SLEP1_g57114 [Rubroshorea leprosula]
MCMTFQLGFNNFINFTSFAVKARSLRTRAFSSLTVGVMGSKRLLSNSSVLASSTVEGKTDKKLKGLASADLNSDEGEVMGNGGKGKVVEQGKNDNKDQGLAGTNQNSKEGVFKDIMNDPGRINAMTVQQLKAALRNAGLPAKGCKSDLVSALKTYLDKQLDGESSHWEDEQLSSISAQSISVTGKTKTLSGELDAKIVMKGKKLSIEGNVSGALSVFIAAIVCSFAITNHLGTFYFLLKCEKKPSEAIRKATLVIDGKDTNDGVNVPMSQSEPWTIFAHKKPQKGWIAYNPQIMRPPPLAGNTKCMKLMSWNVNGLRALLKLEGFSALELAKRENFDLLCLQETKLQEKDVESIKHSLLEGYENSFWTCSVSKLGYSGTAIISQIKPLSVRYGLGISDHDSEGRLVTAEFDTFYLLSAHVPNSGDGLRRLPYRITEWDQSLSNYMKELEKSKPVILTGDLNCAHEEIDIYDPIASGNKRSAGFTNEERQSFGTNFISRGFVDTFRKQHPDVVGYTYWGYRHGDRKTNRGWRLDYFLVSESIADKIYDSYILPDVTGSDHCPIGLILTPYLNCQYFSYCSDYQMDCQPKKPTSKKLDGVDSWKKQM